MTADQPTAVVALSEIAQMICGYKLKIGKRTDTDRDWTLALKTAERIRALFPPATPASGAVEADVIRREDARAAITAAFAEHRIEIVTANTKRGGGITQAGHEMIGRADRAEAVAHRAISALAALTSEPQFTGIPGKLDQGPKAEGEAFGFYVEHTVAEPVFLRPPAHIPTGSNYRVTPLYSAPQPLQGGEVTREGEKSVMVCPQCDGEGSYADGVDEAACTTQCTRCDGNGWIVNLPLLSSGRGEEGVPVLSMPTAELSDDMMVKVASGEVVTWAECKRRVGLSLPAGGEDEAWLDELRVQFADFIGALIAGVGSGFTVSERQAYAKVQAGKLIDMISAARKGGA